MFEFLGRWETYVIAVILIITFILYLDQQTTESERYFREDYTGDME